MDGVTCRPPACQESRKQETEYRRYETEEKPVAGQFEIRVHDYHERISRKGAKTQRRRSKEQAAFNPFAPLRLCVKLLFPFTDS
jgi:hypothetical protein